MRKEATKRGFLLGLLVGLVMLIGASQAVAYTLVAQFDCNTGDTVNGYTLGNGDVLSYNGTPINFWTKYDVGTSTWQSDSTAFTVNTAGGSWTALTGDLPQYVLFKGGSIANCSNDGYVYLYQLTNDDLNAPGPFTMNWTYASTGDPANYVLPISPGLSHVSFYNRTTVPIPGAVWLLGSGLSALLVARRRRKRN